MTEKEMLMRMAFCKRQCIAWLIYEGGETPARMGILSSIGDADDVSTMVMLLHRLHPNVLDREKGFGGSVYVHAIFKVAEFGTPSLVMESAIEVSL